MIDRRARSLWCASLFVLALSGCGRVGVSLISLGHGGGTPHDGDPTGPLDGGLDPTDAAADGGGISDAGPIAELCNGMDAASYLIDDRCGVGYCRATNTPSSCVAGVETACLPGAALGATDATCDGVDDDCDGLIDEDFPGRSTTCAAQSCAPQGTLTCVGGKEVDSCTLTQAGAIDAACDGIDDDCDGTSDEDFVASATSCGVGACASSGMSACSNGKASDSCTPGAAAASDVSCNGIDDDCNGSVDEDFVVTTSNCGAGVCARTGMIRCSSGATSDSCVPGSPTRANDPAPANGLDDDCDGKVDEDACDKTPTTYGPGSHPNLTVPAGCTQVTVQLWGGGGASGGKSVAWSAGNGGRAGAGGYATSALTINGPLTLYVGNAGASGCNAGGSNAGSSNYAGGSGGSGNGNAGGDTVAAGGGLGGNTSEGGDGGKGCYGGGGGGQGAQENPWDPAGGQGGGGGAASVLLMNGTLTLVAGGGGGSGGEAGGWWGTSAGGTGGDGCSGAGAVGTQAACGAAGGGGLCLGATTHPGVQGVPFANPLLPMGQAVGATDDCAAGGGGYAIVTFGS